MHNKFKSRASNRENALNISLWTCIRRDIIRKSFASESVFGFGGASRSFVRYIKLREGSGVHF